MSDTSPTETSARGLAGLRVLSVARGVAAAYALRTLADFGADCSWWQWVPARAGEWPTSDDFRAFFEDGVDTVKRRASRRQVLERVGRIASSYDLVLSD